MRLAFASDDGIVVLDAAERSAAQGYVNTRLSSKQAGVFSVRTEAVFGSIRLPLAGSSTLYFLPGGIYLTVFGLRLDIPPASARTTGLKPLLLTVRACRNAKT